MAFQLSCIEPRLYCETVNELHSYITSSKRGFLTQAELFRYYRQRHENTEIPYRILGYRTLLDLLSSDSRLFAIDLRREPAYIYSAVKLRQQQQRQQGSHPICRQHHSANALDEQQPQIVSEHHSFKDHSVPFNESPQQNNVEMSDEEVQIYTKQSSDTDDRWQTPSPNINNEKNNEETLISEPIPLLSPRLLPVQDSHFEPIVSAKEDNESLDTRPSFRKLTPPGSRRLTRSISTSTSSLPSSLDKPDFCIFLLCIIFSFCFVGTLLYKIL